jgi:hypothetical protein
VTIRRYSRGPDRSGPDLRVSIRNAFEEEDAYNALKSIKERAKVERTAIRERSKKLAITLPVVKWLGAGDGK